MKDATTDTCKVLLAYAGGSQTAGRVPGEGGGAR